MTVKLIALGSYYFAFIAQVFATLFTLNIFFRSKSYRLASGALALGFALMVGRRITPLLHFYIDGYYNSLDAFLALAISTLLFFGLMQIKKIILELEKKNNLLELVSKTDSLTQALSRSETFHRAELEIERSLRTRKPVAFLMLDIDHFKNVNDRYGHPVVDLVLRNLASFCQEELRAIDIFGRVGGEEFLVVLPDSSESTALEIAERLRTKIASMPCAQANGCEIRITISIGVACFDPLRDGETEAKAVLVKSYKKSDEAMYLAKTRGRNRSECWTI